MSNFTEKDKQAVWNNESNIQKDMCKAWMKYEDYNNTDSDYGWQIDHIYPKAGNGEMKSIEDHEEVDKIINLQPFAIKNNGNGGKGNDYPKFYSVVESDGDKNIEIALGDRLFYVISTAKQAQLSKLYDL
jgi:hypothetical protein